MQDSITLIHPSAKVMPRLEVEVRYWSGVWEPRVAQATVPYPTSLDPEGFLEELLTWFSPFVKAHWSELKAKTQVSMFYGEPIGGVPVITATRGEVPEELQFKLPFPKPTQGTT